MELELEIQTGESCFFTVNDVTSYIDETLKNESLSDLKYSESVSIVLLNKKRFNNQEDLEYYIIPHDLKKPVDIPTKFNGIFDFYYIVVPTKEKIENTPLLINEDTEIYYFDNGHIYKLSDKTELQFKDLINFDNEHTNISMVANSMTSICIIKKHFKKVCCEIYEKRLFNNPFARGMINNQLIYTRDLLWTIINLISYYTDKNNLYEAERLIEKYNKLFFNKDIICNCNGHC